MLRALCLIVFVLLPATAGRATAQRRTQPAPYKGENVSITVTVGGERTTHIARSAEGAAIAVGTEVVVSSVLGPSVVVTRASVPASGASS